MFIIPSIKDFFSEKDLIDFVWEWRYADGRICSTNFQFSETGTIEGFYSENERTWSLSDDGLKIFRSDKSLMWNFQVLEKQNGKFFFRGFAKHEYFKDQCFYLTQLSKKQTEQNDSEKEETVRLVIWDLDDTFWEGTLSEGEVKLRLDTLHMIRELNNRGIVNAICSKNTYKDTREMLERLGVWDDFVFARISWNPKGPQVKDIVEKIQLRPESILFIDDNLMNLNEVKAAVPGIRVAEPDIIKNWQENPIFRGKPDLKHKRLKAYRILESKQSDKEKIGGDNEEFLRSSNIRISFHTDVEKEFSRIHELVNRTNQLNFTKNRWPEDIEDARKIFEKEVSEEFFSDFGYIKVSDSYGDYGICGFYFAKPGYMQHFLFSCRIMNMGVEQYVWNKLGRKHIDIKPPTASDLNNPSKVDWITLCDDANAQDSHKNDSSLNSLQVCLRGACDLAMTSFFLKTKFETIEEFNYSVHPWEVHTNARSLGLYKDQESDLDIRTILEKTPGPDFNRYNSDIIQEKSDVYVISFGQEGFMSSYRHKKTGLILSLRCGHMFPGVDACDADYTSLAYNDVKDFLTDTTEEKWNYFKENYEFIGGFRNSDIVKEQFQNDVIHIFTRLKHAQKKVIILGLNEKIGRLPGLVELWSSINSIVKPLAEAYEYDYIDINDYVKTEADLTDDLHGTHYKRSLYKKFSDIIGDCIAKE